MVSFFLRFLGGFVFLVGVLLRVAFIILLERRVLSYIQVRKGPNRVRVAGLFQSFGDAVKLFIKEQSWPIFSNARVYYRAPILAISIILLVWLIYPLSFGGLNFSFGLVFIFCCLSLGVYVLIIGGWSSNSNYSIIGAVRGVSQTISYEVRLVFLLLSVIMLVSGFGASILRSNQEYI